MRHILLQTLRLLFGLLGVLVGVGLTVSAVTWVRAGHELPGPEALSFDATPSADYVSFPLERRAVIATFEDRHEREYRVLRLDAPADVVVRLGPEALRELSADGRLQVRGRVTVAHPFDLR